MQKRKTFLNKKNTFYIYKVITFLKDFASVYVYIPAYLTEEKLMFYIKMFNVIISFTV